MPDFWFALRLAWAAWARTEEQLTQVRRAVLPPPRLLHGCFVECGERFQDPKVTSGFAALATHLSTGEFVMATNTIPTPILGTVAGDWGLKIGSSPVLHLLGLLKAKKERLVAVLQLLDANQRHILPLPSSGHTGKKGAQVVEELGAHVPLSSSLHPRRR